MLILAITFGVCIGVVLGLLGSGGSILSIPLLVYVLGIDPKSAIPMSLAIVGSTAAAGVFAHWRRGAVRVKVAVVFGLISSLCTLLGVQFAHMMTGDQQMSLFTLVLLIAAINMLYNALRKSPILHHGGEHRAWWQVLLIGASVGILSGTVGVGGGFIIVPALYFVGLPIHQCMGTALIITATNCLFGVVGYVFTADFHPDILIPFAGTACLASIISARFSHAIPQRKLKVIFAIFLICVGVATAIETWIVN